MLYPLIMILSIPFLVSPHSLDDPETWRPFDHPAISLRVFSAYTRPARVLSVTSEVSRRVQEVLFDEGDQIPGQVGDEVAVILLDSDIEQQLLKSSRIALELAKSDQSRAELAISRARTSSQIAQRDLDRVRELHGKGDASDSDLDRVVLAQEEARVALELALVAQRDAGESVRAAESEVALIETRIDKLTLTAPAGWRVERRMVEPGSGVLPGTPLMVFADLTSFEIEVPMAEAEVRVLGSTPLLIERIADGQKVQGVITFVGSVPDAQTRRRRVVIKIPAEEFNLESFETGGGLEMKVTLEVPDDAGGVRIPHRFVGRRLEQWVVRTEQGKVYVVSPVRSDDEGWIVLPGDLPVASVLVEY